MLFKPRNRNERLKPCPFCGGADVVYSLYDHQSGGQRYTVFCTGCLASIDPGWAQNTGVVRDMWNRRAASEKRDYTENERLQVFYEMQERFDEQDVRELFDQMDDDYLADEYGVTRAELEELIPLIAGRMRRYIDRDDDFWINSRESAANDIILQYRRENKVRDKT